MARHKHASKRERPVAAAAGWIKASTLMLIKMATGRGRKPGRLAIGRQDGAPPAAAAAAAAERARAMRLVEPEIRAPAAYLMEPADEEGDGVDGRATAYIMRVRAKQWSDNFEAAECVPAPPPPAAMCASYYGR